MFIKNKSCKFHIVCVFTFTTFRIRLQSKNKFELKYYHNKCYWAILLEVTQDLVYEQPMLFGWNKNVDDSE